MSVRAELLACGAVLVFLGGCLGGCAAISSPQGGPRDVLAPRLVASSPDSAARNVKQRFVRLEFSEPVQTKDLPKNLLITPQLPANNPYKLREDRNAITLLFDKPLEENTTYSFNFRQGIVDITEALPAKHASLSFSTGPVLDSGAVRGVVTEQLTARPAEDAVIGLYPERDTLGVRRGQPYYLTRTDKQGRFSLGFLKTGRYQLYAFIDKNNNSRFDEGEYIAYLPEAVTLGQGGPPPEFPLLLTHPDRRAPTITARQLSATQLRLSYSEGLRNATIAAVPANAATAAALSDALQLSDFGRAVLLYHTPSLGNGRYLLTATDSTGNVGRDTLNITFPVPTAARKGAAPSLYMVEEPARNVYRQGQVRFQFLVPVQLAPKQPVGTLVEDSLRRRPLRLPADGALSADRTLLTFNLDTKAKKSVDILLDSTAITSVTGQPLHLRPLHLALTEQASTGMLSGTIQTKSTHFELQLLNDKFEVLARLASPKGRYRFDYLKPGSYRLRVLIDSDADGRWRDGDPLLKLPAEPVYVHPKLLQIRANWEVEEALTF